MRDDNDKSESDGGQRSTSPDESAQVASGQKLLISAIMIQYGGQYVAKEFPAGQLVVALCFLAAAAAMFLVGVVLIGRGLRWTTPRIVGNVILMLIPLVNLIVLWRLNSMATEMLRRSGYKVGFFGATKNYS